MESQEINIELENLTLPAIINFPDIEPKGLIIFAHGAGSSRLSPRNGYVADILNDRGFATLLFDLLTEEEDKDCANRFNIDLISDRLVEVTTWANGNPETKGLALGYFGASTGSAAALIASTRVDAQMKAIVSRGGRPDLASDYLKDVKVPTLLIVGGDDFGVIELNQEAYDAIKAEKSIEIVPGATHLFEEPSALREVARLATDWFRKHF